MHFLIILALLGAVGCFYSQSLPIQHPQKTASGSKLCSTSKGAELWAALWTNAAKIVYKPHNTAIWDHSLSTARPQFPPMQLMTPSKAFVRISDTTNNALNVGHWWFMSIILAAWEKDWEGHGLKPDQAISKQYLDIMMHTCHPELLGG
jgi:hypothetical protein